MSLSLEHLGLLLGLGGAFCQALNYALTKQVQEKCTLRGVHLLLAEHLCMFVMVLPAFLGFQLYRFIDLQVLVYLAAIVLPYLIAQAAINQAILLSDSAVVSPLMTLKIPLMALLAYLMWQQSFTLLQLAAMLAIFSLGALSSKVSGRITLAPLAFTALGCLMFCLSDIAMTRLTHVLPSDSRFECIGAAIIFEYIVAGVLALPFSFRFHLRLGEVTATWPVALVWLLSMVGIVGCFNLSGVVEGNIIQTLRGVFGVLITYFLYASLMHDRDAFGHKLMLSLLLFAAVVLYYL